MPIKVIAFDADDTLWDCQSHFEQVEEHLYSLIAPYCDDPKRELFKTESANMADLGYGCKAFTISIIETALRIAGNDLSATQLSELLAHSKQLLHLPATPLPGVEQTLRTLRQRIEEEDFGGGWRVEGGGRIPEGQELFSFTPPPSTLHQKSPSAPKLVVFTKGELQDQENKLKRSGLLRYFDDVEITSDKGQAEFLALCEHQQIHPSELLMVGNSLKSDIAPALAIGAWAIHIPFYVTWQLETFDDFDHERMVKVDHFADILNYI